MISVVNVNGRHCDRPLVFDPCNIVSTVTETQDGGYLVRLDDRTVPGWWLEITIERDEGNAHSQTVGGEA